MKRCRTAPFISAHIREGERQELRDLLEAVSRHAYDGETLLVPGVPEAPDQSAAMDAFLDWLGWVEDCLARKAERAAQASARSSESQGEEPDDES